MKNKSILGLKEKAERSFQAAKILHEKGDYDFAISRAYYAIFYIAEALLLMKGKEYSTHSALISGFHQIYIQTGLLQRKFHTYLDEAYDLREEADYDWETLPAEAVSRRVLRYCEEFFQATERFFKD